MCIYVYGDGLSQVSEASDANDANADAFLQEQADALESDVTVDDTELDSLSNVTLPDISFSQFLTNFNLQGETFGGSFELDPVWEVLSFLTQGLVYADLAYVKTSEKPLKLKPVLEKE